MAQTVEPFRITTLSAPGRGRIGLSRLPGRHGDLAGDVAAIRAWGASMVVSLTPALEMAAKGAADLPRALAAAGIAWHSFPIPDYGAPDGQDEAWAALSPVLHAALDRGEGVLLHCAGGRGRSGMVAMRLLVEREIAPAVALAEVRAVRPGAVETAEQASWASRRP